MNRFAFIVLMATGLAAPCGAGLRFGLGNAVAERGAEVINKAGAADPANAVGTNVAATLPVCSNGAIYGTLPTDLSQIISIVPLGNHSPPPHTFPSDHLYFYPSTTTVVTPPLYAPTTIHIIDIASTEYLNANPVYSDYAIYFYACRNVESYFSHVRTLSPALLAKVGSVDQNCYTYTTGATYRRCDKPTNIVIQEGELLGTAATSGAFDFGSYDDRITPLTFISPSRHYSQQALTVCPIDYFTSGPKASMEAKLGRFDGLQPRTVAPLCGGINFDVAGSASGNWYHVGSPDSPEDPHLSLSPDNVDPTRQVFSVGNSVSNLSAATYTFIPVSAGYVNRDFTQVQADGQIYCYDTFFDPVGQANSFATFLIQLTSQTTLTFERQNPVACGAGPWAFTGNAVHYQR